LATQQGEQAELARLTQELVSIANRQRIPPRQFVVRAWPRKRFWTPWRKEFSSVATG
jgi:hypothetical protein